MIGQREVLRKVEHQTGNNKFPRFSILIGERGSGRKTLARHIAKLMGCAVVDCSVGVEDIRNMLETAYKVDLPLLYLIADADKMSQNAANAILKAVEEPPKNAYFVLTCENVDSLLPTIKSRGVTYMLEPYSFEEKMDYLSTIGDYNDDILSFMLEVCSTPGELNMLTSINIETFMDYVNLVVDNIAEVSGSNAFKIADKIALKDEEDKYDIRLFLKAFISLCSDKMRSDSDRALEYARATAITGNYLQQLSRKGINKIMLFDAWILEIRSEWL